MNRSPLNRKTPMNRGGFNRKPAIGGVFASAEKNRKPLRRRAKGKQPTRPLTDAERAGGCQIQWDGRCQREAHEVHHRKLRSQGGSDEDVNRLPGCVHCHRAAHRNPTLSYATSVMIRRDEPETPFVRVAGFIITRASLSASGFSKTQEGVREVSQNIVTGATPQRRTGTTPSDLNGPDGDSRRSA